MYQLAIFDLDGTLVDSCGDIADALNEALLAHGRATHSDAAVATMVGEGVLTLVRKALGGDPADPDSTAVLADYRRCYRARPVGRTRVYPGVTAVLAAHASLPMAIATNKPGGLAREVVAGVGLARHFFAILGEDDFAQRKPDPAMVDWLRACTGARRADTVLIGDSPTDAATAEAAGVDLVLVNWGYATDAARARCRARYRIDDFALVGPILDGALTT